MIVKVQRKIGSWSYFECQVVHTNYLYDKLKTLLNKYKDNALIITDELKDKKLEDKVNLRYLNLEIEGHQIRGVLTDSVIYLLNNEGKTIDTI